MGYNICENPKKIMPIVMATNIEKIASINKKYDMNYLENVLSDLEGGCK